MKIALTAMFAATVAAAGASVWAQDVAPAAVQSIPAGVPLRVQLDRSYRMRVGTKLEGHLTEPVYLVDHIVIPANSKVYGTITGKHPVNRQVRTAAMFNGDLTPLKNADVAFNELDTPDGRHFQIDTEATERTTSVVRMSSSDVERPHHSLGQRIASVFRWTKKETVASLKTPHKWDVVRQTLYTEVPIHPQELWAGTQYDAELKQPLALPGIPAPAPEPVADLTNLKLTGTIEARLLDSVDSGSAHPGTPVEAVLTQPLFQDDASADASSNQTTSAVPSRGKLLLPEGTHLIGTVVQAKPAGMFGRNGSLRLSFRKVQLPEGDERVIHGSLTGAETQKNAHVRIDDEGNAESSRSNLFMAPISLGGLAAVGDNSEAGLVREAMAGNGLDLLTRVIGTVASDGGLVTGFAYYEAGKIVFDQWIGRGHEVSFPKNTRLEIELAQR